jgi:rare lipoprotein A
MRFRGALAAGALVLAAAGHTQPAAEAKPAPATPSEAGAPAGAPAKILRGKVSYYGRAFAGRTTASGESFDPQALTMAHRDLPFGTRVRVTNRRNGRSVVVVVNDRGPAVPGRIGDVSLAAARRLGMVERGVIPAKLEVLAQEEPGAEP